MKTLLNTNLFPVIRVGMYNSQLSPDYLFDDCFINQDFEQGYTYFNSEYFWDKFDNSKFEKQIQELAKEFIEDIDFSEVLTSLKIEGGELYSPKEYNFKTDNIDLVVRYKKSELYQKCIEDPEAFDDFLNENYRSRSGFWSFTSDNIEDWKIAYKENNEQEIGAGLTFLFREYLKDWEYCFYEYVNDNIFYSEFFDSEDLDNEIIQAEKLARQNYLNIDSPEIFSLTFKKDFHELTPVALEKIFFKEKTSIDNRSLKLFNSIEWS